MKRINLKLRSKKLGWLAALAGLVATNALPLHAQAPVPYGGAGPRPVAVLLCQYAGNPNTYGFTPASILATWMSNTGTVNGAMVDDSINGLVQDASLGTINFQGTQAFGWFTLPNPLSSYTTGYDAGNDCIGVAQKNGVNFAPFKYVAVYMNDALADAQGESYPSVLPGVTLLTVNVRGLTSPPLVLHELGHILASGGLHTDSTSDPLGGAALYGDDPTGTPPFSIAAVSPEWDASRRELMGFIPAASLRAFSGGTQTYNLSRLTQPLPGLPTVIDVPLPNGSKYVISARTQIGYDSYTDSFWGNTMPAEGVKIELFTSTQVDAHIEMSNPGGDPRSTDAVWLTGQTYTDSANGITVKVVSFNPAGNPTAQITVSSTASPNALPPGSWQTQAGSLVQISAGYDGTVAGIDSQGQVYQWTGQGFTKIEDADANVAVVNSTKIFLLSSKSLVHLEYWNGTGLWTTPAPPAGVTAFTWLSAASDGTLYAVDSTGNVNRLDPFSDTWSVVGSNAGHVAAKNSSVFYMLQSGSGTLPAGTIQMVSGATITTLPGNLKDITVDSVGDLWGVNGNNTVYHWNGAGWDQEPGTFTQIAVGSPTTLWAVNANAQGAVAQWH